MPLNPKPQAHGKRKIQAGVAAGSNVTSLNLDGTTLQLNQSNSQPQRTVNLNSLSSTPGGTDTQVQFNDSSAFGGNSSFTYNGTNVTIANNLLLGSNLVHNGDTDTYLGFETDTIKFFANNAEQLAITDNVITLGDGVVLAPHASDNFTIDSPNGIILDGTSAANGVQYHDGSLEIMRISNSSSNPIIRTMVDAKDMIFQQFDGTEILRLRDNLQAKFSSSVLTEDFLQVDKDGSPGILVGEGGDADIYYDGTDMNINPARVGSGILKIATDTTIAGNLTVQGTTTTIDSTTLSVKDKNIELGVVSSPTDVTADGGGITLKGTTDKTFNWVDSTDSWTASEHIELASGKSFRINGNNVLNQTTLGSTVVSSSLTSLGTLTALTGGTGDLNWDSNTLFVDSSENRVGIGTNSPDVLFDVSGAAVIQSLRINANDGDRMRLFRRAENEMVIASESASLYLNSAYNGIYFENASSAVKMRMTNDGDLGIGTTSPDEKLDVRGDIQLKQTGDTAVTVLGDANRSGADSHIAALRGKWNGTSVGTFMVMSGPDTTNKDDGQLTFQTASAGTLAERMRIDETGNVGIGTTTPTDKLNINTGAGTFDFRDYNLTYSTSLGIRAEGSGYLGLVTEGANEVFISTNGFSNKRLTVKSDGKVGIGTTSPNSKMTVQGDLDIPVNSRFRAGSGGADTGLDIYFNNSDSNSVIENRASGGDLVFRQMHNGKDYIFKADNDSGTEQEIMRIDGSNARVGIGTTSPSEHLHVESDSNTQALFKSTDNRGIIQIADDDTTVSLVAEGTKASLGMNAGLNAANLNIDNTGKVGIGTTSPGAKLHVSGNNSYDNTGGIRIGNSSTYSSIYMMNSSGGLEIDSPHSMILDANRHMEFHAGGTTREHRYMYATTQYGFMTTADSNSYWAIGNKSIASNGLLLSGAAGGIRMVPANSTVTVKGNVDMENNGAVLFDNTNNNNQTFIRNGGSNGATLQLGVGAPSNGNTKIHMADDGDVGLGTTSPAEKLDVRGKILIDQYLRLQRNTSTNGLNLTDSAGNAVPVHTRAGFFGDSYTMTPDIGEVILYSSTTGSSTATAGKVTFASRNDAGTSMDFAQIEGIAYDDTASGEDGHIVFRTEVASTMTERMRLTETGLGIGLDTPTSDLHIKGELDIQSGNQTILMGAGNSSTSRSDNTLKLARVGLAHYHNNEAAVAMMFASSNGTDNTVAIGGGTSGMNAATKLQFLTATNDATTEGSVRMQIGSDGKVGIGTTPGSKLLTVNGTTQIDGEFFSTAGGDFTAGSYRFRDGVLQTFGSDRDVAWTFDNTNDRLLLVSGNSASNTTLIHIGADPTDGMYVAGSVGIGTTGPNAKLEVASTSEPSFRLSHTVGSIFTDFYTNSAGRAILKPTSGSNTSNGLAIGPITPAATLHVYDDNKSTFGKPRVLIQGGSNNTGDPMLSFKQDSGANEWSMGLDNDDSDKFKLSRSSVLHSNTVLTIDGSNNIGIGTTSPGETLHVAGTSRVTGKAAFGSSTLPTGNGISVSNTIQVAEISSAPTHVESSGILWVKNDNPTNLYFTDDDGNDIALTNNGSAAGGGGTIGGSITDNQVAFGASTANTIEGSANLTYDGTNLTLARTADNTSRGISIQDNEGTETVRLATASGDEGLLYLRGPTGGNSIYLDGNSDSYINNGANFGIGTTAPDSTLDIRGDGTLLTLSGSANAIMKVFSNTDDASIDIYAGADGNVETGYVQFYDDNTKKWFIGKDTGNDFLIYDVTRGAAAIEAKDNSDLLLMQGGGNVGIGTTSPAKTLHIKKDAGHFRISSADYDLISMGPRGDSGSNLDKAAFNMMASDGSSKVYFDTAGDSYINGGDLGIGTASPQRKLHVMTASAGSPGYGTYATMILESDDHSYFQFSSPSNKVQGINFGDGNDNAGAIYYDHATDYMRFFAGAAERVRIDSAGKVGIGTNSPNEKLTVEGVLSLDETSAPSATSGYGKIYVKSSDSKLYFMNDSGTETDLTAGGGSTSPAGSDTQVQFNNGGSFGADSKLTWDDTKLIISTTTDSTTVLKLSCTDADANDGPLMDFSRELNAGETGDGDQLGKIRFNGDVESGSLKQYAAMRGQIVSDDNTSTDGKFVFETRIGGSNTDILEIGALDATGQKAVYPSSDADVNLGSSSKKFGYAYAARFIAPIYYGDGNAGVSAGIQWTTTEGLNSADNIAASHGGIVTSLIQNITSDVKTKTNIEDYTGGLSLLNKLKPKKWNWKDEEFGDTTQKQYGLIVQDVEEIDSSYVEHQRTHDEYGDLKIFSKDFNKQTQMMLVSAIQELSDKNDALEARIKELESKL